MRNLSLLTCVALFGALVACGSSKDAAVAPASPAVTSTIASSTPSSSPLVSSTTAASTAGASGDVDTSANGAASTCASDVARMRPRFRRCYQAGLKDDPKMEGREIVVAVVRDDGVVESAKIESNAGLSASVAECIRDVAASSSLHCGGSDSHNVRIPVNFVRASDSPSPSASSATP